MGNILFGIYAQYPYHVFGFDFLILQLQFFFDIIFKTAYKFRITVRYFKVILNLDSEWKLMVNVFFFKFLSLIGHFFFGKRNSLDDSLRRIQKKKPNY